MYYETDVRMAGGTIKLLCKKRSYLIFSDYIAWLTVQEMSIPVRMRIYPVGYGKIMNLVYNDDRLEAKYIKTRELIDEYFYVCHMFDYKYLETVRVARLCLEVRYGWFKTLSLLVSSFFLIKGLIDWHLAICSLSALFFAGVAMGIELLKNYKKLNFIMDDEVIQNIKTNGKIIKKDENGMGAVYAFRPSQYSNHIIVKRDDGSL